MTDFIMRTLACASLAVVAAHITPALAQEVQVFTDGKPFAINEEINAAFAPARDERKARRHLDERRDAALIAAAHEAAFLHCGLDESKYPPEKKSGRKA